MKLKSFASAFICVFGVAITSQGGIVARQQDRFVEAGTGNYLTSVSTDNGPFQHIGADGFSTFSAIAASHHVNEFGDHADASVSQTSSLSSSSVFATGKISAGSGDDDATYRSLLHVVFDVNRRTFYSLLAGIQFPEFSLISLNTVDPFFTMQLARVGMAEAVVDYRRMDLDILFSPLSNSISTSGILEPGTYDLLLDVKTTLNAEAESGTYLLQLRTGRGATAVPLPTSFSAGLVVLAVLAVGKWFLARRQRIVAG